MDKPSICSYCERHYDPLCQSCVDCLVNLAEEIITYLKWLKSLNFDNIVFDKKSG